MFRHLARLVVCTVALAPMAGCLGLEQAMVFHPRRYPAGDWQLDDLAHEDALFTAADGTRLHGWYAAPPNPQAVVLYCHGNAGNVTSCDWVLSLFSERLNCAVLVFDYRGYGKSDGTPSEAGILADARAARRWLAQRTGVAETDVVVVGRSLGGAVAVDLAARDGARALVLESTFTSLGDMAACKVGPLPVRWLMDMNLDSLSLIRRYHGPLLVSHGDADRLIPFEQGQRLFAAANDPKWFVPAPGRGHNDLPTREYVEALDRFLDGIALTLPAATPHGK
jgi:fermentation-respiration switch protein FrsA (DUF1100 family)